MTLTQEQIHAAADMIAERGERPTQVSVRKELGGGLFSIITPALQSWNLQQYELSTIEVPEGITYRFQELKTEIWQEAVTEAERRLFAERQAFAVATASANTVATDAQEAVITLEQEAKELTALIEAQSKRIDQLEERLRRQQHASIVLSKKLTMMEHAV